MNVNTSKVVRSVWRWIGICGLAVIIMGCGVRLGPVYLGQPTNAAIPFYPAHTLLISATPFPDGWQAHPCDPRECDAEGIRRASRTFYNPTVPGHAIQDVIWYDTEQEAVEQFQRIHEIEFRVDKPDALTAPPEITYQSIDADAYEIGCGYHEIMICRAMMRYGQYVVLLYFHIDEGSTEGIPKQDINAVLEAVDMHISSVLAEE